MNSPLIKDTLRKVWATKGRFLAITAIIAIGSGFFTGVKMTSPGMKTTADEYYSDTNLMDFRFVSTIGFGQTDIDAVRAIDGITEVDGGFTADVMMKANDSVDSIVRIYSCKSNGNADNINRMTLLEGRFPSAPDECLIESETPSIYGIGDTVSVFAPAEMDDISDCLSVTDFKVVGRVSWSMYVDFERGSTTIGNGAVDSFLIVPEESFAYEKYTVLYIKTAALRGLSVFEDSFSETSEAEFERLKSCAEELGAQAAQKLYDELSPELCRAQDDYNAALDDYNDAYGEYEAKLADAQAQIDSATAQIGEMKLKYDDGLVTYNSDKSYYDSSLEAYNADEALLDDREAKAAQDEAAADKIQSVCGPVKDMIACYATMSASVPYPKNLSDAIEAAKLFDNEFEHVSEMLEYYATLPYGSAEKATYRRRLDNTVESKLDEIAAERERIAAERSDISAKRTANETTLSLLKDAELKLEEGLAQLEALDTQIKSAESELDTAMANAESTRAEADALFSGQKTELDKAKADIDDGFAELDKAVADVSWYAFDRSSNTGYSNFEADADRVDSIARVFPIFFILVAALVCLTTMTRMIEEERTEIGTLMALGYRRETVFARYLAYSAAASVLGVALGLLLGVNIIPRTIYQAYLLMYNLPSMIIDFPVGYSIACLAVALACTGLTSFAACAHELGLQPAQLMRPKAPKSGKRVLLEKIPFIWNKLSFNAKVTARNVFRFKSRVLMTVLGICGCTALLLTGFTLKYAISVIVDRQYDEIFIYDYICTYDDSAEPAAIESAITQCGQSREHTHALIKTCEAAANGSHFDCYIVVPEDADAFRNFVILRNGTGETVNITGSGAVINKKLADLLGVEEGDEIALGEEGKPVRVAAINENYTFNYIYMPRTLYVPLFGEYTNNTVFGNLASGADSSALSSSVLEVDGMLNITFSATIGNHFRQLIDKLDYIVLIIIAASGALAFVVLYNLSNINILERKRELATIKVLGFFDGEVSAYIYRESIIVALIGLASGLFAGVFLAEFVVRTSEVDVVMFARDVPPFAFALASAVTIAFIVLVNIIMYFKMQKIDMAASMKAVE